MWDFLTGKQSRQKELETLSNETEKYRTRAKEAERRIEDLQAEVVRLKKQVIDNDDHQDDLQDDLEDAQRQNKKLTLQVTALTDQLAEYKSACESLEMEVSQLKQELESNQLKQK